MHDLDMQNWREWTSVHVECDWDHPGLVPQEKQSQLRESFPGLVSAADHDFAAAQYSLGYAYANGQGAPKDGKKALYWLRRAAEQNHDVLTSVQAQRDLGRLYRDGFGVTQDDQEAARLFRKASEQGDALAHACLADMYAWGRGVDHNDIEAVRLYKLAAGADPPVSGAQHKLGMCFQNGQGVDKDYDESRRWHTLAANQDHPGSLYMLAVLSIATQGDFGEAFRYLTLSAGYDDKGAIEMLESLDFSSTFESLKKPHSFCVCCRSSSKLQRCSACKSVWYCSRECQRNDFKIHKLVCSTLKNMPSLPSSVTPTAAAAPAATAP